MPLDFGPARQRELPGGAKIQRHTHSVSRLARNGAVQYQEYLLRKHVQPRLDECKSRLEVVARGLHQQGHFNATPHDDYLYLLNK